MCSSVNILHIVINIKIVVDFLQTFVVKYVKNISFAILWGTSVLENVLKKGSVVRILTAVRSDQTMFHI